jgi:FkbM family methyltransferase
MSSRARVVYLAVGTRGDCEPLAILAAALARRGNDVHFVTHRAHRTIVEAPLAAAGVRTVQFLSQPPSRPGAERCEEDERDEETMHREECVRALETSLGCSIEDEDDDRAAGFRGRALVVINLFALEGWHIAESLGYPCVVASPCVPPGVSAPPSSFARKFERYYPGPFRYLHDNEDGLPVSWREVEHWMWPLLSEERWGSWRVERLQLDPVPFLTKPKARGQSSLLYGISPSVLQVPGYWPSTAKVCGFWFPPAEWERDVMKPAQTDELFGDAARTDKRPSVIAIVLSTVCDMGLLGTLEDVVDILHVLRASLKKAEFRGIVVAPSGSVLGRAFVIFSESRKRKFQAQDETADDNPEPQNTDEILTLIESVSFQKLFHRCAGVIHHGGSGSTGAALRAGIPQVVIPFFFDQFFFAEKVAWLGVASLLKSSDISRENKNRAMALDEALENLGKPELNKSAKEVQRNIERETESAVFQAVEYFENKTETRVLIKTAKEPRLHVITLSNTLKIACTQDAIHETKYIFNEIFTENAYFRHGIEPTSGGVIIDVGANIGLFFLATHAWLRRNCGSPPKTYIAFEPIKNNAAAFKKNAWIHGLLEKVDLISCGLTNEFKAVNGVAAFAHYPSMPGNSTMVPEEKESLQKARMKSKYFERRENVTCRVSTLHSELKSLYPELKSVDLLKIDAEGSEYAILEGMSPEDWDIIRQVVIEVHDVQNRVSRIKVLLEKIGFFTAVEKHEPGSDAFIVYARRDA